MKSDSAKTQWVYHKFFYRHQHGQRENARPDAMPLSPAAAR
jgi:hypothetical protein